MAEAHGRPQPRRTVLRFAALGMVGLLAACGGVVPRPAGPVRPAPEPEAPPPVRGGFPGDEARNRVAVLVPLSGANAGVGQSIANAASMALLDSGGQKIRITVYDTNMGGPAAAAQKALGEGNRLFLGPLLADEVRAVAPVARRAGVPVVAFSNDSEVAGGGVYLMGFTLDQSVDRVVRYAASRGITRFAGLMPNGTYGRRAANALLRAAAENKASVTAIESYERSPAAIAAAVRKVAAQPYDALLIADSGRIAIQAAPLAKKANGSARLLGTELWNTEATLGATPALRGAWFASVPDATYQQFASRYRARFGRLPYRLASLGYDAMLLVLRSSADWRAGAPFPAARLTDRGGFAGVDGAFRFRPDGIAERMLAVHEVAPGGLTTVSAAPRSFGE